jgi:hypothetical protein
MSATQEKTWSSFDLQSYESSSAFNSNKKRQSQHQIEFTPNTINNNIVMIGINSLGPIKPSRATLQQLAKTTAEERCNSRGSIFSDDDLSINYNGPSAVRLTALPEFGIRKSSQIDQRAATL